MDSDEQPDIAIAKRKYLISESVDDFFIGISKVYYFIIEFFKELFSWPFEWKEVLNQCYQVGYKSLPLVSLTGFITGLVFTKQSRPSLVTFGASSWLPGLIAVAIIRALAPLVTALIAAGKVGSNMGAELGSIIYENEPIEANTMLQKPRPFATTFFNWKELTTSIIQGLAITVGTMLMYQYAVRSGCSEATTRTMIFTVLVSANITLTLVNRSFYYSIITTLHYKNNLVPIIIAITIGILVVLLFVPMLTQFFLFQVLSTMQLVVSVAVGFTVVIWYEVVKWLKRQNNYKLSQ